MQTIKIRFRTSPPIEYARARTYRHDELVTNVVVDLAELLVIVQDFVQTSSIQLHKHSLRR